MRHLGATCNTARAVKQKAMQAMKERDDGKPLGGLAQLDDAYWGGERRGGKRGRGPAGKTPFVAAVSPDGDGHPVATGLSVAKGFRKAGVARRHAGIVTGGGPTSVTREEFAGSTP